MAPHSCLSTINLFLKNIHLQIMSVWTKWHRARLDSFTQPPALWMIPVNDTLSPFTPKKGEEWLEVDLKLRTKQGSFLVQERASTCSPGLLVLLPVQLLWKELDSTTATLPKNSLGFCIRLPPLSFSPKPTPLPAVWQAAFDKWHLSFCHKGRVGQWYIALLKRKSSLWHSAKLLHQDFVPQV